MYFAFRVSQHWELLTFLFLQIIFSFHFQILQTIQLLLQKLFSKKAINLSKIINLNKTVQMSSKHTGYSSQEIKNEIQNLNHTRESIQKNKDISGSMVRLAETMNNLKPMMTKQTEYIKNFLQTQAASGSSSQESQMRRYANRIFDISVNEISQLLLQGEKYFSIDIKQSWKKIASEVQKSMLFEKQKIQSNNATQLIQFLFKVMNIKDNLFKEFLRSIIYRKLLLCKDLNIEQSRFVHSQKKALNKLIESYSINKGYVPPKPFFQQIDFSKDGTEGTWSLSTLEGQNISMGEILKITTLQVEQIFSIIRNYANLNEQQRNKEEIRRNDLQVVSLRQKIDQMDRNYQILQRKYRQAISKDQKLDVMDLREKLKEAEQQIQAKQHQIKQLNYQFRDSSTQMQTLKQKVAQLTSDLQKLTKEELIKLKDLQNVQKNLGLQFTKLYQSIKSFGNIFQFQNDGKKSLANQIIASKNTIQKMASMLCRQKQKNRNLQNQITRLNQIILQLGNRIKLKRIQGNSIN